ncbi:MAG: hypothetical protein KF829_05020 [Ferruginibacter sp.]|nr:hypothetical protein [Ferruginibacter sp.]
MVMPSRKYDAGNGYRYGFNGKENDNEVKGEGNQQDYGERIYDSRLGRFLSTDPLYKQYPELTPYQFSSNNPVFNIDIDGLEGTGGAAQIAEKTATTTLRVATKNGVEQGAKVVAMKAAEKVVESPGFWSKVGTGVVTLGKFAGAAIGTVVYVLTPTSLGTGDVPDWKNRPWTNPNPTALPESNPAPGGGDDEGNKPKTFYVTYTKMKVNPDGTVTRYSGRSSGTYTGIAPTPEEKQTAVDKREATHTILNSEGYQPAQLDQASTSYAAIRGREQQLIDYNGGAQSEGGTSRNKIRGVGRKNVLRNAYNTAATAEFGALPSNNPVDKKTP